MRRPASLRYAKQKHTPEYYVRTHRSHQVPLAFGPCYTVRTSITNTRYHVSDIAVTPAPVDLCFLVRLIPKAPITAVRASLVLTRYLNHNSRILFEGVSVYRACATCAIG